MRVAMIAAGLVGILSLSAFAVDPAARVISTTGNAVIEVEPNEVTLALGVETLDRDLDAARSLNDKNSQSLLKAIKDAGIDDKNVKVANMNLGLDYNGGSLGGQFQGYRISRWYLVKLTDTKKFMDIVGTALKNGANLIGGFQYDTTDLRKYRDQARTMAIKAAKEKAVALAADLGCEPGLPLTISERNGDVSPMNGNSRLEMGSSSSFSGEGENTMPSGEMSIQATVDVTFELKDIPVR